MRKQQPTPYTHFSSHGGAVVTQSPLISVVQTSDTMPGKVGGYLPMVGLLQYRTLANCMYWFSSVHKTTHYDMTYAVLKVTFKNSNKLTSIHAYFTGRRFKTMITKLWGDCGSVTQLHSIILKFTKTCDVLFV